jgi:hypothetical protein
MYINKKVNDYFLISSRLKIKGDVFLILLVTGVSVTNYDNNITSFFVLFVN